MYLMVRLVTRLLDACRFLCPCATSTDTRISHEDLPRVPARVCTLPKRPLKPPEPSCWLNDLPRRACCTLSVALFSASSRILMPAHTPHTSSAPAPARTPPHPPAPALPHAHPTIGSHRLPRLVIRDAHGAPNAPLPWTLLPSSVVPLPRGPPTRKAELPRVKEAKSAAQACVALPHIVHGNAIVSMMRSDPVPHRPCRTCQPRTKASLASHVFLCLCACAYYSLACRCSFWWDDMVYTEADAFREAGADRKRLVKWESRKYKQVRDACSRT